MRLCVAVALCLSSSLGLLAPTVSHAVNLVPNDGFEFQTSCPVSFGQITLATPWDSPTAGTLDAYHTCVTGWPPLPVPSVPVSIWGFQNARTGNAMAGFIARQEPDVREYLQVPLNSPLVAGQTYNVSFWVNLPDTCDRGIDRIGAYFSVGPVGPIPNWLPLPFTPQVESPAGVFYTDTLSWAQVSGSFVAAGGESHMIIGNFHDDGNSSYQLTGNAWPGAYYFVDDVSVELADAPVDQACCLPSGACAVLTPSECQAFGGTAMGVGTSCDPGPCGPTPARGRGWGAIKAIYR